MFYTGKYHKYHPYGGKRKRDLTEVEEDSTQEEEQEEETRSREARKYSKGGKYLN